MAYSYNGTIFGYKKEWNTDTQYNTSGPEDTLSERNQSHTHTHTHMQMYDFIHREVQNREIIDTK